MSAQPAARPKRQSLGAIFRVPGVIAALTCAGLLSALLGDGIWDAASWLTLSLPAIVVVWCVWLRRR